MRTPPPEPTPLLLYAGPLTNHRGSGPCLRRRGSWGVGSPPRMYVPLLILTLFFCVKIRACHPECTWQCDDPVCPAACSPVCLAPSCQVCNNQTSTPFCVPYDMWSTSCPPDQSESDSCPVCAVTCTDPCRHNPYCFVQCEEVQCAWQCHKPDCPYPTCELQCDAPACQASTASCLTVTILTTALTLLYMT